MSDCLYAALGRKLLNRFPPNLQEKYKLITIRALKLNHSMVRVVWLVSSQTEPMLGIRVLFLVLYQFL